MEYDRKFYEERIVSFKPGWHTHLIRILHELDLEPIDCVLDAGCGSGFFLQGISTFTKELCVGVDLCNNAIKMAKKASNQGNTAWITASTTHLPFREEVFSKILSNHVIEHISNYRDAISEMGRVLKKGGKLVIATPSKHMHFLFQVIYRWWVDRKAGHLWRFSYKALKRLLEEANLTCSRAYYYGHIFFFLKGALGRVISTAYTQPCPRKLNDQRVWHLLDVADRRLNGPELACFSVIAIK